MEPLTLLAGPDADREYAAPPREKPRPRPKPTKPKTAPAPKAAPVAKPNAATVRWASFGVSFTLVLSALLNGYANAQNATVPLAGWLMGLSIPVIVLVLAKVASEKYRDGQRRVAYFAGGSGVALLFLSVYHCATSIALLTGSGMLLAVPLAVAVDSGLVALEFALVSEPREAV